MTIGDLSVGMTATRSYYFSDELVNAFAELVDDHAPVHINEEFAKQQGFEGRIVHGLFVQAILSGILGNELPGSKSVINSLHMKMHKPVLIGSTVNYHLEITGVTPSVAAVTLNFTGKVNGQTVLSGKTQCSLPGGI